jgi:hypothetical protein
LVYNSFVEIVLSTNSNISGITGLCMSEERLKKHTGKCYDCGGSLELVEFDVKKSTRIMSCQECGLYHFHKRELFGGWKLLKVSKKVDM